MCSSTYAPRQRTRSRTRQRLPWQPVSSSRNTTTPSVRSDCPIASTASSPATTPERAVEAGRPRAPSRGASRSRPRAAPASGRAGVPRRSPARPPRPRGRPPRTTRPRGHRPRPPPASLRPGWRRRRLRCGKRRRAAVLSSRSSCGKEEQHERFRGDLRAIGARSPIPLRRARHEPRARHRRRHDDLHRHVLHHLREPRDPRVRGSRGAPGAGASLQRRSHLDLPRRRGDDDHHGPLHEHGLRHRAGPRPERGRGVHARRSGRVELPRGDGARRRGGPRSH